MFALSFVFCSSSTNENSSENTNLYINGSDSTVAENNVKNETEENSLSSNVVSWENIDYNVNAVLNASETIDNF